MLAIVRRVDNGVISQRAILGHHIVEGGNAISIGIVPVAIDHQ